MLSIYQPAMGSTPEFQGVLAQRRVRQVAATEHTYSLRFPEVARTECPPGEVAAVDVALMLLPAQAP